MAWDDLKILGKDSETLAGRDDHHVPNDSEDYQPDHRKSSEEIHWGMGDLVGARISNSTREG